HKHLVASVRDVSGQQAKEAQLTTAVAEAGRANLAKSTFLTTVSHEIRSPLNVVLGALELLDNEKADERSRELLNSARVAGKGLLHLISDVLDLSRVESGVLELAREEFDLNELLEGVIEQFQPEARRKSITLRLKCHTGAASRVLADPARLTQILVNLVGNALKFTENGEVLVVATRDADTGRVRFDVRDTGIGLDESTFPRLLEEFTRAASPGAEQREGSGLGLSITSKLLSAMGSRLECQSRLGIGSRFFFELELKIVGTPAQKGVSQAAADAQMDAAGVETSGMDKGEVLLVEDSPGNRLVVSEMLRRSGFTVRTARNGFEAVELFKRKPFEVVLMDLHMPVMDGYEAAGMIRTLPAGDRRPTIIALSASVEQEERDACTAVGMDGFLSKPLSRKRLAEKLAECAPAPSKDESLAVSNDSQLRAALDEGPLRQLKEDVGEQFFPGVVKKLLAEIVERCDVLQNAISPSQRMDARRVRREAHTLASVAATCGMLEFSELCRDLSSPDNEFSQAHTVGLIEALVRAGQLEVKKLGALLDDPRVMQ
ncbi:MAG: response regulator, partial [Pseudomonadota bacterium]